MKHDVVEERVKELLSCGLADDALRQAIVPQTRESRMWSFFEGHDTGTGGALGDLGLTAGLTLGDMLYDWCRVDPMVLEGVDFASKESVAKIFRFSSYARHLQDMSPVVREGSLNRFEGYVGERVVAAHLQAAGHVVMFPSGPTETGWDMRVDGHPFQVKCVEDPRLVLEHLERHPDIPVYVPDELHDRLAGHEGVHFVPGFSHEHVERLTHDSIDAGADVLDFEIPWVSICVSALRNVGGVLRGTRDLGSFLVNVFSEVAGGYAGGLAGAKTGALALGVLFGPAGVLVGGLAGSVAGATVGRSVARGARSHLTRREEAQVIESSAHLLRAAASEVDVKLSALSEQSGAVTARLALSSPQNADVSAYFDERASVGQAYLRRRQREIRAFSQDISLLGGDPVTYASKATELVLSAHLHPVALQQEYKQLIAAHQVLIKRRAALGIGSPTGTGCSSVPTRCG